MKQPQNDPPPFSKSNNTLVSTLLVLIGLGILLLIAIVVFAFQGRFPSPAFLAPATQTQPFPTLFFPTSECGSPTLLIGSTGFKIQNVSLSPYGTVKIPADTNGIAYHVEGAGLSYSFLLSPTQENILFLAGLTEGTTAKATSINCHSKTFALSTSLSGSFRTNFLLDQSPGSIVLFIQTDATGNGLVTGGRVVEE